jgi:hypothetical protein
MPSSLSDGLPEAMKHLQVRPLFLFRLSPTLIVPGQTPNGFRRIGVIESGSFEGDRLSGEIPSGGSPSI